ncbi:hypothetical protein DF19_13090 [Streptomyces olindensis]|nr:hypothetical protein DF19_13090 [Streptomyces olindensis]
MLTDRRYRTRVQDDARRAQRLGVTGAPFIVVDGRYGVPGAQDSDTLLGLLRAGPSAPRTPTGRWPVPSPSATDRPVAG